MGDTVLQQSHSDQRFLHRKVLVNNYRKTLDGARMKEHALLEATTPRSSASWYETSNSFVATHQSQQPPCYRPASGRVDAQGLILGHSKTSENISQSRHRQAEQSIRSLPRDVSSRVSSVYLVPQTNLEDKKRATDDQNRTVTESPAQSIPASRKSIPDSNISQLALAHTGPGPIRNISVRRSIKPYQAAQSPRIPQVSDARRPNLSPEASSQHGHQHRDEIGAEDGVWDRCRKLEQQLRRQSIHILKSEEREAELQGELGKLGCQWNAFHHKEMQKEAACFRDYLARQVKLWEAEKLRELDHVRKENQELRERLSRADKVNEVNQRGKFAAKQRSLLMY